MNHLLSRMIKVARGHANVADVLFSCGEFTRAEVIEHLSDVVWYFDFVSIDPLRKGVVS